MFIRVSPCHLWFPFLTIVRIEFMKYTRFGNTGLKVSRLCLGTAFRGTRDEGVASETIKYAIDHGINFIDCANFYGRGWSETVLGKAIVGRRDDLVITSKVHSPMGDLPNDRGASAYHIMREVERSLKRLQTDHIDLYLLHHWDPETPLNETLRALDNLIQQGKVRYFGCCNYTAWQVCKGLWTSDRLGLTPLRGIQHYYNLLDRSLEHEHLGLAEAEGLGVMTFSPIAVGLLLGHRNAGRALPDEVLQSADVESVIQATARIAEEAGKTPAQVAIAWVLSHPQVSAAITGPDSVEQLEENFGGVGWELNGEQRERLDAASAWTLGGGVRR